MLKSLTQNKLVQRGLSVRAIAPEDQEFLYTLYASSRAEEMAILDWDESFKEQFLRMQFQAQHQYYHETFIKPQFSIILLHGEPIGRIYCDRCPDELSLAEITLLPDYRGQGIGTAFIHDLMAEATETRLPLRLYVEHFNRAYHLYSRLGFKQIGDYGVYYHMEWRPDISQNA